jgi:hypothetical protein
MEGAARLWLWQTMDPWSNLHFAEQSLTPRDPMPTIALDEKLGLRIKEVIDVASRPRRHRQNRAIVVDE